jgi:hypothetical protein
MLSGVFSTGDAYAIGAVLGLIGVVFTAIAGTVLKRNTDEHKVNGGKLDRNARMAVSNGHTLGLNSDKLDEVVNKLDYVGKEVTFIRTDVSDIHGVIHELRRMDRDADERLTSLERKHNREN